MKVVVKTSADTSVGVVIVVVLLLLLLPILMLPLLFLMIRMMVAIRRIRRRLERYRNSRRALRCATKRRHGVIITTIKKLASRWIHNLLLNTPDTQSMVLLIPGADAATLLVPVCPCFEANRNSYYMYGVVPIHVVLFHRTVLFFENGRWPFAPS